MRIRFFIATTAWLGGILATGSAATPAKIPELVRVQAWSVNGPGRFDASGLTRCGGEFLVVSDRHHDTIFRLEPVGDELRAVPAVTFTGPVPYPEKGYLDLEGVTPAPDGGFLVAPEWGFAVVHVPAGGGLATWATPDLREAGRPVGLFATTDAYLEGVTWMGADRLLVVVERQPRGVIEIAGEGSTADIRAQVMNTSKYPCVGGRNLDFADVCTWRERVFALSRNQHLVVELQRDPVGNWSEGEAWSYAETENDPAFQFVDRTYGIAEGLAIDDAGIYVLFDNNNVPRAGAPEDRRPWLFAFQNPLLPPH